MKKRNLLIILLSLCLAATAFVGCGADSIGSVKVEGVQDTDYTVYSNGGNAVQYGNYVYFINGTAGYEDENGDANVWGKVVKGALYRAELNGEKNGKEFDIQSVISSATDEPLEFKASAGKDYDDNDIDVVNVQVIAPKVIGTSGYASGGIFIYDNYVYYASPNNQKNKAGAVQYSKTDFFRTSLDGKTTQKLLTTENDSASSPYAFYKQGDKTYLVALDGTTLKSVEMNDKKILDTAIIAEDVTSALLPTRSTYYKGMPTSSPEDFVYIVRSATEDDTVKSGSVLEFMRPDGSERTIFLANGGTSSLEAVRDGVVFYRTTKGGDTVIRYSNLHDVFLAKDSDGKVNSPSYKEYEDAQEGGKKRTHIEGDALKIQGLSSYTFTYAFRPSADIDPNTDVVYVLASDGSAVRLFGAGGESVVEVASGSATINTVIDGYAYFNNGDGRTARFGIYKENGDVTKEDNENVQVVSDRAIATSGLPVDVCAGYLVYFGKIDEWASNYALFNKLPGLGLEKPDEENAVFVGIRSEADVKPDEDEEE